MQEEKIYLQPEDFTAPRQSGDEDLVEMVRDLLSQNGLVKNLPDAFDRHPLIIEAKIRRPTIQRFLLNQFWLSQLLQESKHTFEERTYLIPNGDIVSWINFFRIKIIPCCIHFNLPRVII